MVFLQSVALLLPAPRPTTTAEVATAPQWRGVCEYPGHSPAEMAVQAGTAALTATETAPADVRWVLHAGSSVQGAIGWPVHHHIQQGIIGAHGNALEVRQYCAGGLTAWLLAAGLLRAGGAAICTGADNWPFDARFVTSRSVGGEPFSDVAHAEVLSAQGGFAQILGVGSASRPRQADAWQTREAFWEHPAPDDFRQAYARAAASSTIHSVAEVVRMNTEAISAALADAGVEAEQVTHFVPHPTGNGQPYRSLAAKLGLPWSEPLFEYHLDHGYLGVGGQAAGLVYLAETGGLAADSVVLLVAAEYQLSTTAVVLRVCRQPALSIDGMVGVVA